MRVTTSLPDDNERFVEALEEILVQTPFAISQDRPARHVEDRPAGPTDPFESGRGSVGKHGEAELEGVVPDALVRGQDGEIRDGLPQGERTRQVDRVEGPKRLAREALLRPGNDVPGNLQDGPTGGGSRQGGTDTPCLGLPKALPRDGSSDRTPALEKGEPRGRDLLGGTETATDVFTEFLAEEPA